MSWYAFVALVLVVAIGAAILIAMWLENRNPPPGGKSAQERLKPMLYRFCFLDAQDHAVASEEMEVASLLDAIARAHMMLIQRPHHDTVEIWLGNRRAYRARRDRAVA